MGTNLGAKVKLGNGHPYAGYEATYIGMKPLFYSQRLYPFVRISNRTNTLTPVLRPSYWDQGQW